ncbi:hypothetical protein ACYOEI_07710 [Singulisphaera rosea]
MVTSVWKRSILMAAMAAGSGFAAGCNGRDVEIPTETPRVPYETRRPSLPSTAPRDVDRPAAVADVSWETERDGTFAKFLRDHSGGLIKKAAVGLEKKGELRVEVSRSVAPDDTLPLTKSLMAGARKDFPDRPILLSVYDPEGQPILKAHFRPGEGVRYRIAHEGSPGNAAPHTQVPAPSQPPATDSLQRGGVTERDKTFAAWAESHGKSLIRYVEADLERNGRLWFGVTRDVKPADVRPLTKSLLEGARKEFPKGELVATVFDPEGERIGKAHLERDGEVRWED